MIHVLGIRHHGPGSARRLRQALEKLSPDIILIEGPPEGNDLLKLAADPEMVPPVALLVYQPNQLEQAAYYPFAEFSPEWQAIQYGAEEGIPARFIDLSMAYRWEKKTSSDEKISSTEKKRHLNPLGEIARLAGFEDGEEWWDAVVESKGETGNIFEEVLELMKEVRSQTHFRDFIDEETLRREAFMRREIRQAMKDGHEQIAVVCGAFHAPVLRDMPPLKEDQQILKGMKKVSTTATWIPWTYERLSYQSGYGAGVHSPQWYEMRFGMINEDIISQWMTRAAHLFRNEDLDASPAHIIEGVRLAYALANLRGYTWPRLRELMEAVQTVFAFGDEAPLLLIEKHLVIGSKMGSLPEGVPTFPLQEDIRKSQKSLRLKPSPEPRQESFDLRKDLHLRKSHFLHRLNLLQINWGERQTVKGKKEGSFHEIWVLQWTPEMEIQMVEAATWGNTVLQAAIARVIHEIRGEKTLPELTGLLEQVFLSDLGEVIPLLTHTLSDKVALSSDMQHFLQSLPALVNVLRYGNVRKTDAEMVEQVIESIVPRLLIGLPGACRNLNEEFADTIFDHLLQANSAIQLLTPEDQEDWAVMLAKIASDAQAHPKIGGAAARILFDYGKSDVAETASRMSMALSAAVEPMESAGWLEGFLHGTGLLLIHNPGLWLILDEWLKNLDEEVFTDSLPLLRRTFSKFAPAERRQMGQIAKNGLPDIGKTDTEQGYHEDRIRQLIPTLKLLLGYDR